MMESVDKYYTNMKQLNQIITQYEKLYQYYDQKCDVESCIKNEIISKEMYKKLETRYY